MIDETFPARVSELGGALSRGDALRAARAVLTAIGERLRDDERAMLARELPTGMREALDRAGYRGDFDRDELFARVARHAAVDRGFAIERAEVVCQALGEALPEEALVRLKKQLGASIASLFEPRAPIPTIPRTTETSGSTLASGREGGRHPMSEARNTGKE
jgi:uncharacterized protein (DUF2267 family)